jgi:hypothetical protein
MSKRRIRCLIGCESGFVIRDNYKIRTELLKKLHNHECFGTTAEY